MRIVGLFGVLASFPLEAAISYRECNFDTEAQKQALIQFEEAMQAAAQSADVRAFLPLLSPRVRVNYEGRHTEIKNRHQEQFLKEAPFIFTDAMRKAILAKDDACVGARGLMYGGGAVWVNVEGEKPGIVAFNVAGPGPKGTVSEQAPERVWSCKTAKHRILVEGVGPESYRYRSWGLKKAESAKADLELLTSDRSSEGTGGCASTILRFRNGSTVYTLSSWPCSPQEPASVELRVTQGKKEIMKDACVL